MTCQECHALIHGFVDDELDLLTAASLQGHLDGCSACAAEWRAHRALRDSFAPDLYANAPPALRQRIEDMVRQSAPAPAAGRAAPWRWLALAACIAVVCLGGWLAMVLHSGPSHTEILAQQVLGSHLRSLMAEHLTDVASTDRHTVKPWFNGKLDFSPPVIDLAKDGFPLVGGRLDFLDNRPVAALVYGHRLHRINLFIWPSPSAPARPPEATTLNGYHLFHWTQSGMTCWAVSDLNETDLRDFAALCRPAAASQPAPPARSP